MGACLVIGDLCAWWQCPDAQHPAGGTLAVTVGSPHGLSPLPCTPPLTHCNDGQARTLGPHGLPAGAGAPRLVPLLHLGAEQLQSVGLGGGGGGSCRFRLFRGLSQLQIGSPLCCCSRRGRGEGGRARGWGRSSKVCPGACSGNRGSYLNPDASRGRGDGPAQHRAVGGLTAPGFFFIVPLRTAILLSPGSAQPALLLLILSPGSAQPARPPPPCPPSLNPLAGPRRRALPSRRRPHRPPRQHQQQRSQRRPQWQRHSGETRAPLQRFVMATVSEGRGPPERPPPGRAGPVRTPAGPA